MGMCVFKLAFVDSPHVASAHVSQNPWPPQDQLVAWGVDFAGAWVITPKRHLRWQWRVFEVRLCPLHPSQAVGGPGRPGLALRVPGLAP